MSSSCGLFASAGTVEHLCTAWPDHFRKAMQGTDGYGVSMLGTTDETMVTRYSSDLQTFSAVAWSDNLVPPMHLLRSSPGETDVKIGLSVERNPRKHPCPPPSTTRYRVPSQRYT